ncbi:MAG TPA: hypothetical protein H9803_09470 [Candidatus Ligilactobacillus excrementavium]|nr:hypothetical protein [Candidatus Ligilactobacillus excrementavium]
MVDWKFGSYKLIWWLIVIIISFPVSFINGWIQASALIIMLLVLFSATFLFERKKPQFKEKNRQSTISYFHGICICLMLIVYFTVTRLVPDFYDMQFSGIFPILCLAFADTLPSFFTKSISKNQGRDYP